QLRPAFDQFEMTGCVGVELEADPLLGERYAVDTLLSLCEERHLVCDGVYFVAHDDPLWQTFDGAVLITQEAILDAPGAWHPGDALSVPLRGPSGEVLALFCADEPADLRRPSREAIEIVSIVAQLAGWALDAHLAAAEAAAAQREQQALSHL